MGAAASRPVRLPDLFRPVNYAVEIHPEAAAHIAELAAESADSSETGGILLGRGPDTAGLIVVEQAGEPGPKPIGDPTTSSAILHTRSTSPEKRGNATRQSGLASGTRTRTA